MPIEPDFPRLDGIPILIVDDNATNRLILEEVLANWGARPTAVNGAERRPWSAAGCRGTGSAVRRRAGRRHDARHRWSRPGPAHSPRSAGRRGAMSFMLTSRGGPEDTDICTRLRIAASLTKPVRQSELFDAMMKILTRSPARSRAGGAGLEAERADAESPARAGRAGATSCSRKIIRSTKRWRSGCSNAWGTRWSSLRTACRPSAVEAEASAGSMSC